MDAAALDSFVEIAFTAYPDEIFTGKVTSIGDAQMDSNTNTTVYEVTVTIDAQAGSKLYEGMTAVVTLTRPESSGSEFKPESFAPGSMPQGMPGGGMGGRR